MGTTELIPLDEDVDHVRGPMDAPLVVEYGDYECPYSRAAFRAIERVERARAGGVRFAFRHFPLTEIHPRALQAAAAAEAAARQGRIWEMHELLFRRQGALEPEHLRVYAEEIGLDSLAFTADLAADLVLTRVERDVRSGVASGQVRGTPTLFIDGAVYRGAYDPRTLLGVLAMPTHTR